MERAFKQGCFEQCQLSIEHAIYGVAINILSGINSEELFHDKQCRKVKKLKI